MSDVIVPIVFFIAIAAVVIFTARYRHLEQMEALRQGVSLLPTIPEKGSLLVGLILLALGIALALTEPFEGNPDMFTGAFILVFLGGAFLLFYRLTAPDRKRAREYLESQHPAASGNPGNDITPTL